MLYSPIIPLAFFALVFLSIAIFLGQLFSFGCFIGYWLCMFYEIKCEVKIAELKAAQWQYDQNGAIIWSQMEEIQYFGTHR